MHISIFSPRPLWHASNEILYFEALLGGHLCTRQIKYCNLGSVVILCLRCWTEIGMTIVRVYVKVPDKIDNHKVFCALPFESCLWMSFGRAY